MIIAFIALAVIALVFLFVYNARVSRKSARKHAENQVQAQQSPAASETVETQCLLSRKNGWQKNPQMRPPDQR